ncbi:MAG TPA: tetratricopeptide repeat protein [Rickettsiales bacterium]|nr:tetratricopeptide repeat protein [Rickettsiales bacterium]
MQQTPSSNDRLTQAMALHQAGNLDEAEKLYRQLLAASPKNADVLTLLGVIEIQRGAPAKAIKFLDKAIAANPKHAMAYHNYGSALAMQHKYREALVKYDAALSHNAENPDTYYSRATVLFSLKRFQEAVESCQKALTFAPENAVACNTCAAALLQLKRYEEALAYCDRAIMLQPGYANAHNNRAIILQRLKRYEEALESCDRALTLSPNHAEAHSTRGSILRNLKRYDEALASCDKALGIIPGFAEAHNNRGNALLGLRRYEEAYAAYHAALASKPDYAEAHSNLGFILQNLQRYSAALIEYERAIALQPDYAEAQIHRALLKLLLGEFEEGWREYEWRWKHADTSSADARPFEQPLWLGAEPLAGKTILLHSEQGFGDTLQFCRYASMVEALGANVIMEVQAPLVQIVSSVADYSGQVMETQCFTGEFDFHCPLMSLPHAFKTTVETVPAQVPYLHAPPATLLEWQARLGAKTRPRIGIAWSGAAKHVNDHNRSIALHLLQPLLEMDFEFFSLQKEVRESDAAFLASSSITHLAHELRDFSDTAALASEMDLVISVDTSLVHLAGALGKKTWVLLPVVPDYRWLLDREDSPWYPTARLFRQQEINDWGGVIARVVEALRHTPPDAV